MAANPIDKTTPGIAGVVEVAEEAVDTVNGNSVSDVNPRTIITVRNADASNPHTVTFVTSYQVGGLDLEDKAEVIPANTTKRVAGFDPKYFGRTMVITGDSTQLKLQAMQV